MKVGFEPDEVINLYHGLVKDVWTDLNLSIPAPCPLVGTFRPTLDNVPALTNFNATSLMASDGPYLPWGIPLRHARWVEFNESYLKFLYQDELIGIILHELAHAIVGPDVNHEQEWSDMARSIGGHYHPTIVLRKWADIAYRHDNLTAVQIAKLSMENPAWYDVHA